MINFFCSRNNSNPLKNNKRLIKIISLFREQNCFSLNGKMLLFKNPSNIKYFIKKSIFNIARASKNLKLKYFFENKYL